jgi:hypothetical protein
MQKFLKLAEHVIVLEKEVSRLREATEGEAAPPPAAPAAKPVTIPPSKPPIMPL